MTKVARNFRMNLEYASACMRVYMHMCMYISAYVFKYTYAYVDYPISMFIGLMSKIYPSFYAPKFEEEFKKQKVVLSSKSIKHYFNMNSPQRIL